jgi:hypothetical protein
MYFLPFVIENSMGMADKTVYSVVETDPDSMWSLDPYPDPDSQYGSGSKRAKLAHKKAGCYLLRAEGFSCSLDVLYGGLGIVLFNFWS